MTKLPPDWQPVLDALTEEREAHRKRADRLEARLDRILGQLASQTDELNALTKMLRRREQQLAKAEAEKRKLRRKLGLDEPEP